MQQALINLFNLLKINIYDPIYGAFSSTAFAKSLIDFLNNLINNILKIFNSDKIINLDFGYNHIAWIITLLVLILVFSFLYKLFITMGGAINETFRDLTPSEKVTKKINKLKKKK